MSSITYKVVASTVRVLEEVDKETFGVGGYDGDDLAVELKDLSTDRGDVERFADECNEKGIQPEELTKAAEEYLVRLTDVPVNRE